ncbi:MAG: fasciclin domain-containing protein [Pyrinomonadaceae bacterium]|nr:fasciclin domain-containing protein [Pyrinomonadaceae bacterium]MCX7639904.1 fasciclin domain-containing protein [Pyrinomonadaceae bacterium]MDW8304076.1 fasciclin domain-containing protein [Acidobacteriota bacterium]
MRRLSLIFGALCIIVAISTVYGQYGSKKERKDVVDVAVSSPDHTTLVEAVKAAGLVETLKGKGPFTVFAPVNSAFAALPSGTVESLLKPENKEKLKAILTYHVVSGKFRSKDVLRLIRRNKGKATVKTVQGGSLTLTTEGGNVKITDENGNTATVTKADLIASNGVIHVIDKVVLPKQ